jgi:spore coat protein CotH
MPHTRCCPRDNCRLQIGRATIGLFFAALVLAAISPRAKAAELTVDRVLAPDRLTDIAIELPAADWRELCKQTRDIRTAFTGGSENPFTYFKGDITIDGVKIHSVGIRKKGFIGSLDEQWPSLKIKFDEYQKQQPVKGIDVLTLNNNKQDPSLVSQFLAYHTFNAAAVHAPRVNFARLTVNGEYLGIYSNVESIGKQFLKRRFGNDSGNLYEGTLADFYPSAIGRLEAKNEKSERDRGELTRLAKLLAASDALALSDVEQLVDLDNFIRFWVVESLIGFWDGYSNNQNNYWLYDNRANGKFYFIPWGADGAFMGMRGPFGFGPSGPSSVYAESMLANRLYRADGVAERYRETMREVLDKVWKEDELVATIDRIEKLVSDHLHERQSGAPRSMDGIRQFVRSRRETITKELENWPVNVASQPRKPMYTVEVGAAKGTFTTQWQDKPADNPLEAGRAEIEMKLDGQSVAFKQLGAVAQLAQMPRFPFGPPGGGPPGGGPPGGRPGGEPPRGERTPDAQPRPGGAPPERRGGPPFGGGPFGQFQPPATVVMTGARDSDGRRLTLTLNVEPKIFGSSAGKTIAVQGSLAEGEGGGGFFMPFGGRVVEGKLTLAKAGMNAGDAVEGNFDLKIAETRGGFMDRGRGGRGGPGGFGPPGSR